MASEASFATFTSSMEPIDDMNHYPPYLRTTPGHKDADPLKRGRKIIDNGRTSSEADSCTNCLQRKIPCVRYRAKYGKCAFCTAKDLHPEAMCHLSSEPEPELLTKTIRIKKRKLNSDLDADSTVSNDNDSAPGGRFSAPTSAPRSVRGQAPSPDPSHLRPGIHLPGLGVQSSGSDATLERVTALEDQVARLEQGFMGLLVRLDELNSALNSPVSAVHAHRRGGVEGETTADGRGDQMSVSQG